MRKIATFLLLAVCLFTALKGTDALVGSVATYTFHPVNSDSTIDYETDVVFFTDNGFVAPLVGFVDTFSGTMEHVKNATSFVSSLVGKFTDIGQIISDGDFFGWLWDKIKFWER